MNNKDLIEMFTEYLIDMIWKKENLPQKMLIIDNIKNHLLSLESAGEVRFDYEKYSDVSSHFSLQIFKGNEKIEEYFASIDTGELHVSKRYILN